MNLGDLANLGQVIGALAVVISLFYVAHQIRQILTPSGLPPLKLCTILARTRNLPNPSVKNICHDPFLDPWRGDPRFEALVQKVVEGKR